MKALVLRAPNASFERTEVPDPVPGPGDAVARVLACGSGLTIQHIKAGRGVDVSIDYVSSTSTLEAGVKALGVRGRLVTLGGAGHRHMRRVQFTPRRYGGRQSSCPVVAAPPRPAGPFVPQTAVPGHRRLASQIAGSLNPSVWS